MSRHVMGGYARDYLLATYSDAIVRFGGVPVLLPNVAASVDILALCDGLLLTGGGDFHPATYHAADAGTDWAEVSEDRDTAELALMAEAERRLLPVLGICRGIQALAVGFGGSLIQDISSALGDSPVKHSRGEERSRVSHRVTIVPDTRMAQIVGVDALQVNSFHHQAVEQVPAGWIVSARADDGIVEAMECPGERFMLGVQWHPENLVRDDEAAQRLFYEFIQACQHGGH